MSEHERRGGPADNARPQDLSLYSAMLTFTKQRLQHADENLAKSPINRVQLEACALQVRIALEQIVLATLITNRPGAAAVTTAFAGKTAGEVRKLVSSINPNYWPIPFDFTKVESGNSYYWQMTEPATPYLSEDDWGKAYGYCSSLLHAANPYQYFDESDAKRLRVQHHFEHADKLSNYSQKIQRLLKNHQIYLSEINHSLICHVYEDTRIEPSIQVYSRGDLQTPRMPSTRPSGEQDAARPATSSGP
ncbi:hypothetical protein ACGFIW_11100 [Micromonospora sp. NPDC048935]|uniref:hypothetical protein n=1 Tax=Micromonospora sp. NPDC048935 TaxID=3364262 RepID=UPI003721C308